MTKYKIVQVEFLDHALIMASAMEEEIYQENICYSFGVLYDEDENYYYIATTIYGDIDTNKDTFKAVKSAVTNIVQLGEMEL